MMKSDNFENSSDRAGISFVQNFSHSGKPVKNLDRIKSLLSDLGNPQDSLEFVHIAGTNGKGSAAQMFSEIFRCKGLKTGLFTSPFLITYNDRIQVDGENISDYDLDRLALKVKNAVECSPYKDSFSQFEVTQAIAFLYFKQCGCKIVVLETGLGGLLDCTNVVTTTLLSVITSVDFDHTAILGNTLEAIATQKAGIIKPHTPCILSAGNDMKVIRVVREKAMECESQLVIPNITLLKLESCDCFGSSFEYKGKSYNVSMGGAHQVLNAMSVIEGCNLLADKFGLTYENISQGISKAVLTGRIEILSRKPLTILDGAHNPDGLSALAGVLSHCESKPVYAIIGMCSDKNIHDAVDKIIPYVDCFYTCDGFSDRAIEKRELSEIITSMGGKAQECDYNIISQIKQLQLDNPVGLTLVCGSLYLVSAVKSQL